MSRIPSREQLQPLPRGATQVPLLTDPGDRELPAGPPRLAPLALGSQAGSSPESARTDRESPGGGVPRVPFLGPLPSAAAAALSDGSAAGPGLPPPPPPFVGSTLGSGAVAREFANDASNQSTARGPVKWVPHTHANPRHAKFCFICLHGRLDGAKGDQLDSIEAVVRRRNADDEDLPSPVEMKELGYLSSSGQFRRVGADFERNNVTAEWLRGVTSRVYDETIKGMVVQQNADIALGIDVKLVDHNEDEKDREVLAKMFTLSDDERAAVEDKINKLGLWCASKEAELMDVAPAESKRPPPPEVEPATELENMLMEYKPLLDPSKFKGESAPDAREAMQEMDPPGGSRKNAPKDVDAFKVDSLPRPQTYPDMAEVEVVPYPLSLKDVPPYEPLQPQPAARRPIRALADPFVRPTLFLEDFVETIMPEVPGTSDIGDPRPWPPQLAPEEWLSKTFSIFSDNNPEGEKYGWGQVPPRKRPMPVFIDEPYLPPCQVVGGEGGRKKLVFRGIWDPELVTQKGQMVPPLLERSRELHQDLPFEHVTEPRWSDALAPQRGREEKVQQMIPIIPVKSFAKFRPNKVNIELPDFLWNLAREDVSGQGLWDVIEQRHLVPKEIKERALAADEELRSLREAEQAAVAYSEALEKAAVDGNMSEDLAGTRPATGTLGATGLATVTSLPTAASQMARSRFEASQATEAHTVAVPAGPATSSPPRAVVTERARGMPAMQVEAPLPPPPASSLPLPPGSALAVTAPAPSAPSAPSSPSAPSAAEVVPFEPAQRALAQPGEAAPRSTETALALQEHQQRLRALASTAPEARKVEDLLADDRLLDALADKISMRLGGPAGPGSPVHLGASQASWRQQILSGTTTVSGRPNARMLRPDLPSFAEPADDLSRAQLPKALMGGSRAGASRTLGASAPEVPKTVTDVNLFTQEKMRGECYVRLLVQPEANAARKDPMPYHGEPLVPDTSLLMGPTRPNLMVPPKPPFINEDGEVQEDDEFADFEKNDLVAFSLVRHNRYEAVEALLQQERSILTSKDETGNSLLHVACQNNNRRIAKLLLKNGIEANAQNRHGNTPLHYCSQYGFSQLADYLISHGADETLPNNAGLMPAQGLGKSELATAQAQLRAGGVG